MVRRLRDAVEAFPGWRSAIAPPGTAPDPGSHLNQRTRRLTEGGILAAITVVLSWLSAYVPFLSLVVPTPITLLVYRYGAGAGVMAWLVAGLLSATIGGGPLAVLGLVPAGLLAIALGLALHRGMSVGRSLAVATLAALVAIVLGMGVALSLTGIHPVDTIVKLYEESMSHATGLYRSMGIPEDQLRVAEQLQESTLDLLRLLFPAGILGSAVVSAFVNHWAVRKVLLRMGAQLEWFGPFARWRSTMAGPVVLGLGSLLGLLGGSPPWLPTVALNALVIGGVVCTVQGLSLAWFWFDRIQMGKALRWIILVFALLWTPALAVGTPQAFLPVSLGQVALAGVGFFDPWFNFRRL